MTFVHIAQYPSYGMDCAPASSFTKDPKPPSVMMDPSTMIVLRETFKSQLAVQQQHQNQMFLLIPQLSNHDGFPASSSSVQAVNGFHRGHPADPSSVSRYSFLNIRPSTSQLRNTAAPPGSCSNQSCGYMLGTKVTFHQPALRLKTNTQPATAPLGGCCYQMPSGNVPGSNIPYQQPARSHSAPANYSRMASLATKPVPLGASFGHGGLADAESPKAAPSRFSLLNTHPSICSNRTSLGEIHGTKAPPGPNTASQSATAPLGGCGNWVSSKLPTYVLTPFPSFIIWPWLQWLPKSPCDKAQEIGVLLQV